MTFSHQQLINKFKEQINFERQQGSQVHLKNGFRADIDTGDPKNKRKITSKNIEIKLGIKMIQINLIVNGIICTLITGYYKTGNKIEYTVFYDNLDELCKTQPHQKINKNMLKQYIKNNYPTSSLIQYQKLLKTLNQKYTKESIDASLLQLLNNRTLNFKHPYIYQNNIIPWN